MTFATLFLIIQCQGRQSPKLSIVVEPDILTAGAHASWKRLKELCILKVMIITHILLHIYCINVCIKIIFHLLKEKVSLELVSWD